MTIHQLPAPCWVITPRLPRDDDDPHYDTRAVALAAIRESWDEDRDWCFDDRLRVRWREFLYRLSRLRPAAPRPRQSPARCWAVQCDGECGYVLDDEDEGHTFHHDTAAEARKTVASYEWVYSPDGRFVFCEDDAPEDGQPPPPAPAELEAAGQLVIPGVLP
jgi:hypothetical protein